MRPRRRPETTAPYLGLADGISNAWQRGETVHCAQLLFAGGQITEEELRSVIEDESDTDIMGLHSLVDPQALQAFMNNFYDRRSDRHPLIQFGVNHVNPNPRLTSALRHATASTGQSTTSSSLIAQDHHTGNKGTSANKRKPEDCLEETSHKRQKRHNSRTKEPGPEAKQSAKKDETEPEQGAKKGEAKPKQAAKKRGTEPKQNAKKGKAKPKQAALKDSTETSRALWRIDQKSPQLSDPQEMFNHLTTTAIDKLGLTKALKELNGQVINVATMCSGTESPLLALEMIKHGLEQTCGTTFRYNHLFSAEIAPLKQAYIERNFSPKLLFRDIRELGDPDNDKASTAYGANAPIPDNANIVIAGFSCVDYSKMNAKTKDLDEVGESSDTFRSLVEFARKYQPEVLILENVIGAPWKQIKAIWQNDQAFMERMTQTSRAFWSSFWREDNDAYVADYIDVDTRDYYLPQTRQRTYMICLSRKAFRNLEQAETLVNKWKQNVRALKRPASVSIESILLPEHDPRVSQAKDEFSKITRDVRNEVDWTVCAGRYENYRANQQLGTKRPITKWINAGTAKAPEYWWTVWFDAQTERLWDTFECAYLRNIVKGIDSFHKPRVWEMSQNVDRSIDTPLSGMTGCIVPAGQPFLTTRGGPIIGLEAMALQGLPLNKLLLTRESQRDLQEMAGNAMTTTVVGAAILSALVIAFEELKKATKDNLLTESTQKSEFITDMDCSQLGPQRMLDVVGFKQTPVAQLCTLAEAGSQRCHHEGQTLSDNLPGLECKACGHRSCKACSGLPVHIYQVTRYDPRQRSDPHVFGTAIKSALPMVLQMLNISFPQIEATANATNGKAHTGDWKTYKEFVESVLREEFHFRKVKRLGNWTITYEGDVGRLELTLGITSVQWLLYAKTKKAEPLQSRVRELMRAPIAKMSVLGDNILQGSWQFRLPNVNTFRLIIEGKGRLVSYWESKLGLEHPNFVGRKVWSFLEIRYQKKPTFDLDRDISGTYQLLLKCGTANGFLHKKISPIEKTDTIPIYLFFDPERIGEPKDDTFVFSTDKRRLNFQEDRYIIARIESSWRPCTYKGGESSWNPQCTADGQWLKSEASLGVPRGLDSAWHRVLNRDISISLDCKDAYMAVVSCEVPSTAIKRATQSTGVWQVINLADEADVFSDICWLTERFRTLGEYPNSWTPINLDSTPHSCQTCAPDMPAIKWTISSVSKANRIRPYEDGRTAGQFERSMKAKPSAIRSQIRYVDPSTLCVQIGIKFATLAHCAMSKLLPHEGDSDVRLCFCMNANYRWEPEYRLKPYTIKNTIKEHPTDMIRAPHTFYKEDSKLADDQLRPEQQSSLAWMKLQESSAAEPFDEQEIEEAIIKDLGWRAAVRATKSHQVRGGVLADEVGYGKTVTTLALIDSDMDEARKSAEAEVKGGLRLKATLIIVPETLVGQWKGQIEKFLGKKYNVLALFHGDDLRSSTIGDFQQADIIIMSWMILDKSFYWSKLALLAALPEVSSVAGRAFSAWLSEATPRIEKLTEELKDKSKFAKMDVQIPVKSPAKKSAKRSAKNEDDNKSNDGSGDGNQVVDYDEDNENNDGTVDADNPQTENYEDDPGVDIEHDANDSVANDMNETPDNTTKKTKPMSQKTETVSRCKFVVDLRARLIAAQTDEELLRAIPTIRLRGAQYLAHAKRREDGVKPVRHAAPGVNERALNSLNAHSLEKILGPILNMFIFNRIVIDEFTYLSARFYIYLLTLRCTYRWILSGTPPLDDFYTVHLMAGYIHVHLGIVDDAPGAQMHESARSIRNFRTEVEKMLAYGQAYSPLWHREKQQHAQKFLDHSVRQNKAEIGLIPTETEIRVVTLDTAETIFYRELQQHVESHAMTLVIGGRSRAERELQKQKQLDLKGSGSAAEALLKASSYFTVDLERSEASLDVSQVLDFHRNCEIQELFGGLHGNSLHAEWLKYECKMAGDADTSYYDAWLLFLENSGLGDQEATNFYLGILLTVDDRRHEENEDLWYRSKLLEDQKEQEQEWKNTRTAIAKFDLQNKKRAKKALMEGRRPEKSDPPLPLPNGKKRAWALVKQDEEDEKTSKRGKTAVEIPPEPDTRMEIVTRNKAAGEKFSKQLRALVAVLRSYGKELVTRVRSLRLVRSSVYVQDWLQERLENSAATRICALCENTVQSPQDMLINTRCGHRTCAKCCPEALNTLNCPHIGCDAAAGHDRLKFAVDMVGDDTNPCCHGNKTQAIIELIGNIPDDDQVLLFVQYHDLMININEALIERNIKTYALAMSGKVSVDMMTKFQTDVSDNKVKVLLLNSSNEKAAGINLTNANHVIFVAPLNVATQGKYNASMKQCIGRVRRYGQKKTVHVYHFIARGTFDVDLIQEREHKKLIQRDVDGEKKWLLLPQDQLSPEEKGQNWGSGYKEKIYED